MFLFSAVFYLSRTMWWTSEKLKYLFNIASLLSFKSFTFLHKFSFRKYMFVFKQVFIQLFIQSWYKSYYLEFSRKKYF